MNFSMTITGNTASNYGEATRAGWSASASAGGWWGSSASSSCQFATSQSASGSSTQQETYHMTVRVRAEQDDMPQGLAVVLNLLEQGFITGLDRNPGGVVSH